MTFVLKKGKETKQVDSNNWRIAVVDEKVGPVLQIDKLLFQINVASFEGAKYVVPYFEKDEIFSIVMDVDTGDLQFWRKGDEHDERPNKDRRISKGSFELLQERIRQARQSDSYNEG